MLLHTLLAACTALFTGACLVTASTSAAGPLGLNNVRCRALKLTTPITSQNVEFKNVDDNYSSATYVTQQILEYTTDQTNWTQQHLPSTTNRKAFSASYTIAAQYCTPVKGAKADSSLLLATHGVGFSKSYWNFPYRPEYSFVRHAASYGYSTLTYDRLGCGDSSAPSRGGFSAVQAPTEEAILHNILEQVRGTKIIGGVSHESVTLVGHSYGSVLSLATAKDFADMVQGVVLTGFSANASYNNNFFQAGTFTPARKVLDLPQLKGKSSIYLGTASSIADVELFLDPPNYDLAAQAITRSIAQPVTLGVLFSIGAIIGPATKYTGPVFVQDGTRDLPFCGRQCDTSGGPGAATIPEGVKALFPAARNFSSQLIPYAGHGIVTHRTSSEAWEGIMSFVIANDL